MAARVNDVDSAGYTPLYWAVWADDEATVKTLIAHGTDVNKTPRGDYSPLVYAIWQWHAGNVKALMDAGADINVKDGDGRTPLYWAVDEGVPEVIRLLIDAGAKTSDIHKAVLAGNLEQVKKLVESDAEVNTRDETGPPLSHWALAAGQMEVFDYLLSKGADITAATDDGSTLLHKASAKGLADVVKLLIAKGAEVNARTKRGETALFAAARRGRKEVCQLLVANGADVNAALKSGRHPLGDATLRGHEEVVKLLLANGADVNLNANNYGVALQAAACYGHPALVDILIAAGADVNANTRNGTPLHLAARAGKGVDDETVVQIMKKLLDHSADVHATDKQSGCTPLHIASQKGRAEAARLLIAAGADVNAKDNQGRTPLSYAEGRYECRKVAELLRKHGAKEEDTDSAAETSKTTPEALARAAAAGDVGRVEELIAQGADVNAKGTTGWTGLTEIVKALIAKGAEVDAKCDTGETPLQYAAASGQEAVAGLLIAHGANANVVAKDGTHPLGDAALYGHEDVVKLLIASGANVHLGAQGRGSALHAAAFGGHVSILDILIANGADVNRVSKNGTPLHQAASPLGSNTRAMDIRSAQTVKELLAHGATVDAKHPGKGSTPLYGAVARGRYRTAEVLIAAGANVNAKENEGKTLLALAKEGGRTRIAELLRQHGAK
ncbi:MAG: hypothetical protein A2Y76_09445 [Planctomycetes bacterium RBG_13_60_9]|nr:MAG: hypothetical protein A2Y76_09445 [Planctomycetes bacterium RBG_13_60_9]